MKHEKRNNIKEQRLNNKSFLVTNNRMYYYKKDII